ncbi:uncharacterized protein HaLaN_00684, partial [Haematococcus lacustris]
VQSLQGENAALRSRLRAVEDAASEALGELEDCQERVAVERAARAALELDLKHLRGQFQHLEQAVAERRSEEEQALQ